MARGRTGRDPGESPTVPIYDLTSTVSNIFPIRQQCVCVCVQHNISTRRNAIHKNYSLNLVPHTGLNLDNGSSGESSYITPDNDVGDIQAREPKLGPLTRTNDVRTSLPDTIGWAIKNSSQPQCTRGCFFCCQMLNKYPDICKSVLALRLPGSIGNVRFCKAGHRMETFEIERFKVCRCAAFCRFRGLIRMAYPHLLIQIHDNGIVLAGTNLKRHWPRVVSESSD